MFKNALTFSRRCMSTGQVQLRPRAPRKNQQSGLQSMEDVKLWRDMSSGEKVVHATKQTSYAGIALGGIALTSIIGYTVLSELFSTDQATAVYNRALDEIKQHAMVKEVLGEPIKGFREHHRGHWKRMQVSEGEDGRKLGFMRFGVSGEVNEGTVNAWLHQNEKGHWEFTHLNVETPGRGYPSRRLIVKDIRMDGAANEPASELPVPELQ
jgi:hypothetical protein